MLALLGISTLASLLASLVLGVRLLRLFGRSRQLPELFLGSAFLGAGFIGYIFMLVGMGGAEQMPGDMGEYCFLIGYALISGGVVLTYLFVWRVFQPASVTARVFVGIVCPVVVVTGLPFALPSFGAPAGAMTGNELFVFWLGHAVRIGSGAWGVLEAGRYYLVMRRRLKLGLSDPVVTNRIALWGLASLAGVVVFASTATVNGGGGAMDSVMTPGQIVLISMVSLAAVSCQWFAFLAPAWYVAWIQRRAGQSAA